MPTVSAPAPDDLPKRYRPPHRRAVSRDKMLATVTGFAGGAAITAIVFKLLG